MLGVVLSLAFLVSINKLFHIAASVTVGVICTAIGAAVMIGVWKKYKAEQAALKATKPVEPLFAPAPVVHTSIYDSLPKPAPVHVKAPVIDTAPKLISFIDANLRSFTSSGPLITGNAGAKVATLEALKQMLLSPQHGRVDVLGKNYEWHSINERQACLKSLLSDSREQGLLNSTLSVNKINAVRFAIESALYKIPVIAPSEPMPHTATCPSVA